MESYLQATIHGRSGDSKTKNRENTKAYFLSRRAAAARILLTCRKVSYVNVPVLHAYLQHLKRKFSEACSSAIGSGLRSQCELQSLVNYENLFRDHHNRAYWKVQRLMMGTVTTEKKMYIQKK